MNGNACTVLFSKRFIRELKELRHWLTENSEAAIATRFLLELNELISLEVAVHPTHYPEWKWKPTPQRMFRRAIFRKKYCLVFKHLGNTVEFLVIYHQKRDPESIRI